MFCIGGVNLQTSLQLLPIANDKECKMEQISQNIEKSAPLFVFTPHTFIHPHDPTPLFTRRDKGGYEVNNCKEDTENGASQREKRLCKNSHQSMEQKRAVQQRCATQHKHSTTSVQRNKGVQRNKSTAQVTLHTEVQLLVRFLLTQGKFDVFNLLTECSIRGKLALDFLTTVEDSGVISPTQFTSDLG